MKKLVRATNRGSIIGGGFFVQNLYQHAQKYKSCKFLFAFESVSYRKQKGC